MSLVNFDSLDALCIRAVFIWGIFGFRKSLFIFACRYLQGKRMEELADERRVDWNDKMVMKRLFDRFYAPLRSFAYKHVGDDSITEDFVQTAFLNLWERREGFKIVSAIKNFLYLNVRNACLNYLKRKRVEARHEEELAREMSEEESVDAELEEEVTALVYEALKVLSEQQRRIVLQTMAGASNAEIAERMAISVNTVKTLKLRSYRILRERLKGIEWVLLLQMLLH